MDISDEAFKEAYKTLNIKQREAVDTIEGPVMVVAGPGTGKTQILTLRIANILQKTDIGPENILALTFTESGAKAMRERLRRYVGTSAYRVAIHTFHGFAEELIRMYPDAYEHIIGGRPIRDVEQVSLIEDILRDGAYRYIRPVGDRAFYVPHIIRTIRTLKQEYVSPDDLALIIEKQEEELAAIERVHEKGPHKGKVRADYQKVEKNINKNRELLEVYRAYSSYCKESNLYDYEDMIIETVHALEKNEDMCLDLQETYQYILADEHQDVNGSQNKILELLATYHDSPNLFVVGDEKQAIYRFQGASLENFLYFEEAFKNTTTIALTDNYRSGQEVLDASHALITSHESAASELRVPLTSAGDISTASVEKRDFSHQAVEDAWVIDDLIRGIEAGIAEREIAIIVRTNAEVEAFTSLLRAEGIPVVPSADSDILSHPVTLTVRKLLRAVANPDSEEALFAVLHGAYWGIPASDLVRINNARSYAEPLHTIISSRKTLERIGVTHIDAVNGVARTLKHARDREAYEPPHRVLEFILTESGFLDHILTSEPLEGGRVVRRLYDEIEEMVVRTVASTLNDVTRVLDQRVSYGLPLNAPLIGNQDDAVQVMTAHKSKGLEFTHVYVPHLTDSKWGGKKRAEYFKIPLLKHLDEAAFNTLDDERRLLYVAMTRAKQKLFLSHAEMNIEGRVSVPSRLLEEIDDTYMTTCSTEAPENAFDPVSSLSTRSQKVTIDPTLLAHIFHERGLSVTALNNYLRSPWDYFYRNVLRAPEVQSHALLFGNVMHGTMEQATRLMSTERRSPKAAELSTWLDRELRRLPITEKEYAEFHEKGLSALTVYLENKGGSIPPHTKEEFSLRVVMETGDTQIPEIPLTGVIDRLDLTEEGIVIAFVDYKTGRPKTRNVIEGNTKSSNGEYKRQLVFYALLLSLYDDERYQCMDGAISFLEPDQKGAIHHEPFSVSKEEIEDLRKEIIRVAKEITTGAFLKEPCDPNESSYCQYVSELFDRGEVKKA